MVKLYHYLKRSWIDNRQSKLKWRCSVHATVIKKRENRKKFEGKIKKYFMNINFMHLLKHLRRTNEKTEIWNYRISQLLKTEIVAFLDL